MEDAISQLITIKQEPVSESDTHKEVISTRKYDSVDDKDKVGTTVAPLGIGWQWRVAL